MGDLWTSDITTLYAGGRARQLVPTKEMTYNERVNALVRLVILATVCVYLYNRDGRYLLYGLFSVGLLTFVAAYGAGRPPRAPRPGVPPASVAPAGGGPYGPYPCTPPTVNNPFGNVLLTDFKYNPDRPPACDVDLVSDDIKRAYGANMYRDADDIDFRKSGLINFYTMPDTSTYQAGREEFARACYGSGDTCKQDQSRCTGW